jgi:hypothetical protein
MFRRIHDKLGTAGFVIAIVALIAALGGTAIAGLPGLNSKQKKEVKKIAKKAAKAGPQGPAGAPGAAGAQGAAGSAGKEGSAGSSGTPGQAGEDGTCSASIPKCVLPPGATETGTWSFIGRGQESFETEVEGSKSSHTLGTEEALANISFPLRLPSTPRFVTGEGNWVAEGESGNERCPGSYSEPEAAPGDFCMYVKTIVNAGDFATHVPREEAFWTTDRRSGFTLAFALEAGKQGYGVGSWAVTAPCPENEEGEEEEC